MKTSFALEFSDPLECADFFTALGNAFRTIATKVKDAVVAEATALDLPVAGSEGRSGATAPAVYVANPDKPADTVTTEADAGEAPAEREKRKRRTKAEMEAARAAEAAASAPPVADAPASPAQPTAATAPAGITDEQLRDAGKKLVATKGGPTVAAILSQFDIRKYPDCPAEKRADLLAALEAGLAA